MSTTDQGRVDWIIRMKADVLRHKGGWVVRVFDETTMEYEYDSSRSVDAGFSPFEDWRDAVDEAIEAYIEAVEAP